MKGSKKLLFISLSLLMTTCASCMHESSHSEKIISSKAEGVNMDGYSSEPGDFVGVTFRSRQPSSGQQLFTALSDPAETNILALRVDLSLLERFPTNIPVRVVGFTDSVECSGRKCLDLSEARARAVHDWLISNGAPTGRLGQPYGFGAARPVGDNRTEEGRARNRRAYISYGANP